MTSPDHELSIAIVGMATRVPGAVNLDQFWRNLRNGIESITTFTDVELRARGVESAALQQPHFVKAAPVLEGLARFDAQLFGYSPGEAELLDPQHRAFLECAWSALEHAGHAPASANEGTAIFAGTSFSSYLLFNLSTRPELADAEDSFPVMVANDKDFLATRVAYHLDCRGPAITVQTGCSTSLVAVHLACQALLSHQCEVALAGGVSIHVPQRTGYFHQERGIASPDGHCRAFDARAEGTLFGSGMGAVVLRRLEDALAQGDTIYAIVRGSAINNDGALKVGFTAPGVEGQAEVIARAQAMAMVSPQSISYVEAHGTGTQLGDPIELEALTQAFRGGGATGTGFCGLGSVKTNIGHLDAAAGVLGLIKTALALHHGELPPSLHFEKPNPRLDLTNSPFYVNASLRAWPRNATVRRAGVSSFGIGGTNAHVVLEEAPPLEPPTPSPPWQLLPLAAASSNAVDAMTQALAGHLSAHPEQELASLAWTLQSGRQPLLHRRILVARDGEDAIALLENKPPQRMWTAVCQRRAPAVAFLFAGGGAQHVDMGLGLYRSEQGFRDAVDECCELARTHLGQDLRAHIYPPAQADREATAATMKRTSIALPALFAVQYAMAKLWQSWGVRPSALLGHSLGEYTAACLAGVFSLPDAIALVALRGRLFEELPRGAMLSVSLSEAEVAPLLGPALSLAAINGSDQCVLAGSVEQVDAVARELEVRHVELRRLQIDVAAHSHLVDPLLGRFEAFVGSLRLGEPTLPVISNVTGGWMTSEQARSPAYWARHLRATVRFSDGLTALAEDPEGVLLEVGPGRTLSSLARMQLGEQAVALPSMRHPLEPIDDRQQLLTALGRLWLAGVTPDWAAVHGHAPPRKVGLPTYPFEGRDYWLAPQDRGPARARATKSSDVTSWFYQPSWQQCRLTSRREPAPTQRWLLFLDQRGLGAALGTELSRRGHRVLTVQRPTQQDRGRTAEFTIEPLREACAAVLSEVYRTSEPLDHLVYLWSLDDGADDDRRDCEHYLHEVVVLMQALAEVARPASSSLELWLAGRAWLEVESGDRVAADRAMLLGICKVATQELEGVNCHYVDLGTSDATGAQRLQAELLGSTGQPVVAWRGDQRYVPHYQLSPLEPASPGQGLREHGVYWITGGLGEIGLALANALTLRCRARLVLVSRTGLPPRDDWSRYLEHGESEAVRQQIAAVRALEERGAEVLVAAADVADEAAMRALLAESDERFGALHGVVHCAGLAGTRALCLLPSITLDSYRSHFASKVVGVQVLERVMAGRALDFCLLMSSNASLLGGPALAIYAAANLYQDGFAASRTRDSRQRWLSCNWDGWPARSKRGLPSGLDAFAMTEAEAIDAFERVVASTLHGQVVVSTAPLEPRLAMWTGRAEAVAAPEPRHARPDLPTEYAPPSNELEQEVASAWQEVLGVERLGIHDSFFELGGSSLLWLKVAGRLKKKLGRDIPLTVVFEAPTVAALARALEQGANAPPPPPPSLDSQRRGAERRHRHSRQR